MKQQCSTEFSVGYFFHETHWNYVYHSMPSQIAYCISFVLLTFSCGTFSFSSHRFMFCQFYYHFFFPLLPSIFHSSKFLLLLAILPSVFLLLYLFFIFILLSNRWQISHFSGRITFFTSSISLFFVILAYHSSQLKSLHRWGRQTSFRQILLSQKRCSCRVTPVLQFLIILQNSITQ